MFDIFNNVSEKQFAEWKMDTSYIGDSLESNMQHTQKKPVLHSIPNEHHMHHASLPSMEVASDTHPLHSMKSADDLQAAHQMHDMNSMQTVYDMQTAHNMHKMHEGHAMSMNGSHSMDHFGSKFSNATEMSHGNHHDMSGHNMEHMAHGSMEHMSHGGMGHEGAHSNMSMTFHGGVIETILFSWWHVDNVPEFIGSFIAVFTVALLYEGLKYYRKHLLWKTYSGLRYCAVAPPDKGISNICTTDEPQVIQPTMLSNSHVWQTFLHGVQVLVSYLLMLIFMTYNTWLCSAVVLGSATGYFLFGWRESVVVDFTEHCH